VTKETDDNTKSTEENAKAKAKTAQKEEEAEKREKAHNIEIDKRNKLIEGSLGYFDKLISQLEAESKNLAVGSEEYKKVIALLEKYKKLKEELANITQNNGLEPMDESELQGQKTIAQIEAETRKRLADAEAQDLESFKDKWEQRVEIVQSALSEISNLINTVFQNRIDGIQAEMDANEDYYSHQMELAQDDSVQQNLLEEERFRKQEALRKKQLAEKQKQAKYEKAFNIMQIGLNTASAIVEALPNIPLSIYAGVIGALQLATAIATPIPKYKQGTQGHKGGLAIVGDGGVSEVIAEPNRKPYLSPNTDTLVNLERGTKVFPNIEAYKKYMSDLERASILTSFHNENERMKNTTQIFDFNLLNLQSEIKKGFKNVRVQNQNNIKVDLNFSYWKNKNINF
jgi:hypothetical protein